MLELDPIQHNLGQHAFLMTMKGHKNVAMCMFIWWHMSWATPIT